MAPNPSSSTHEGSTAGGKRGAGSDQVSAPRCLQVIGFYNLGSMCRYIFSCYFLEVCALFPLHFGLAQIKGAAG